MQLQKMVTDQRKALRLDALLLVDGQGVVIAADDLARVNTRDVTLARMLADPQGKPRLVWEKGE
ncbi:MAG TPA: hypothetical protein PKA88_36475, partial [Polyangiaceae bacterium]|nr:hypothetical protein [Polyangiaceae bacterium]